MVANVIRDTGRMAMFWWQTLSTIRKGPLQFAAIIEQMFYTGVKSISTTVIAGGFVGAIMAIQINLQLRDFGAQSFLGGLSASTTIRDIGPVLIAFMLSGKVGAYTSAELATMRVTEQVDAIRCLGTDPIRFLILPRLLAVIASSFLLLTIGLVMSILGGMAIASLQLGVNVQNYVANMATLISPWSVGMGLLKAFLFGNIIALVACFEGYHAGSGSEGVGLAVKRSAVVTLVWILILNYAVSALAASLYELFRLGYVA